MSNSSSYIIRFLVAGIFIIISLLVLFTSDSQLSKIVLSLVPFDSSEEVKYVQNQLNSTFFTKLRGGIVLMTVFACLVLYFFSSISSPLITESKTLINKIDLRQRNNKIFIIVLFALFLLGVFAIPYNQIKSDEAYAFEYFVSKNPLVAISSYPAPNNHILFSVSSSLLDKIIPNDLFALRLPSLVAFLASLFILFVYLKKRYKTAIVYLSLAVTFITFYPLFYSLQGRGYSLFMLWTTIFSILVLEAIRDRQFKYPSVLILVGILGYYTIPVFLYPYAILMGAACFYLPLKSIIKITVVTAIGSLILYTPIIILFGLKVIISNDFVKPLSFIEMSARYPEFIQNFIVDMVPEVVTFIAAIFTLFFTSIKTDKTLEKVFIAFIALSVLIPLIHLRIPPNRAYIFVLPFTCIVLAKLLSDFKYLKYFLPIILVYNLKFTYDEYFDFNQYSIESQVIVDKALERKAEKIYLLDGPRSHFKLYVNQIAPDVTFKYSLNRSELNQELLSDTSYIYISEYRYKEIINDNFTFLDSTDFFYLFERRHITTIEN